MLAQKEKSIKLFNNDTAFNKLFPKCFQGKAARHWTPLEIAQCAADFLVPEDNVHVLDIGSGVGKFCIAAAHQKPNAMFYGVEQRKELVDCANECLGRLDVLNVSFIHGNFTQLDFRQFDHFYFFNSFYENLRVSGETDDTIERSLALYNYYNRYLYTQLEQKPKGTRIATLDTIDEEIPAGYYIVKTEFNGLLKLWVKV
jgi:hypothetical protein